MNNDFFVDKSCALMLGVAIGDALGAPVEGLKAAHIKTLFKTLDGYVPVEKYLKKGIKHYCEPGLYTDDTQQMLAVCDMILSDENFSPADLADLFMEMSKDDTAGGFGVFRGTGRFFRYTMRDMLDGIPWERVAGNTAGCMAAVRIPPLVIKFFDDPIKLLTSVINASLATHKDPMGISAAILQAFFIRALMPLTPGKSIDIKSIFTECKEYCEQGEKILASQFKHVIASSHPDGIYAVSGMIDRLAQLIDNGNDKEVNEYIFDYASHFASMPIYKLTVPFALTLVPLALKIFLHNIRSFSEPIIVAINGGGDTDTLASLVGALSGAYWGTKPIPQKWLQGLANMNQIKMRSEALSGGKKGIDIKPICEMEKQLTFHQSQQVQKYVLTKPQKKPSKPAQPKQSSLPISIDDEQPSPVPKKYEKGAKRQFDRQKSLNKKERRKNKII